MDRRGVGGRGARRGGPGGGRDVCTPLESSGLALGDGLVMSSENDTERYAVVKLQHDHKLANTKAHVACNKKTAKSARRRTRNEDPQKAHVGRGVGDVR